jgi:acyl-CoA thioesterase
MGDLAVDTGIQGSAGRYQARLSRDWEIWGPNGGYLAVIALRAAGAHTPLRRPATFSCHFLGVADFDVVDLDVRSVRESRRAASIAVSMTQAGKPILEALTWIVGDIDGLEHDAAPIPEVETPESLPSARERLGDGQAGPYHAFWSNFDERPL